MSAPLHLVRIPLRGERLFEFASRRGLHTWEIDEGYATHCALRELFGDAAPKPFALAARHGPIQPVLGYTTADRQTLEDTARLKADPWLWDHLVLWNDLAAKPMPSSWREGQRVGFSVRAMPVARAAKDHPKHRKGSEVDVFLLAGRARPDEVLQPETIYRDWLALQCERIGGARIEHADVTSLQLDALSRRHHAEEQRKRLKGRPAVTFTGTLVVTDPTAFSSLLARGVGRHRAFGFGMLLLHPPSR
jgi:CRISPR system Cascade subunit CasE